jgi:hypothetical protein
MATVRVEVTDKDIESGVPCDGHDCPVSLAMFRATGLTWFVTGPVAHRGTKRNGVTVRLPHGVADWVSAFDRKDEVRPFAFDLDVPA